MPATNQSKILPYRSTHMFQLISHVESYPSFLPWVQSAHVYNKNEKGFAADLTIAYQMFEETYTSTVEVLQSTYENFQVKAIATDGPFTYLKNKWDIKSLEGDRCHIYFSLEFELKKSWFSHLLTPIFHHATEKMIEAFEKRAEELFSRNGKDH